MEQAANNVLPNNIKNFFKGYGSIIDYLIFNYQLRRPNN